jgi:hypothetical protein
MLRNRGASLCSEAPPIYPHGMAYEATATIPLWDPRDNHP